ncbi:hypothetical protein CJD36_019960 [Flavipsychrobacter stenotrophus]|uniref:Uncharacterized protein n=1 Tax=Flavipsychrobacter stenotrophus TaxID=2077091 RepID=A0A2S7SSK1_9BACT|nr:hypothetical protein [Flavipsychrobacter stenotrophus]PQJ09516.1 hypothetical protein CJD36_019960 [Flavipsychrobacter stenotrophus]
MKGDKAFDSLLPEPEVVSSVDLFGVVPDAPRKPGRIMELAEARNRKLAARLFYYRHFFPLVKNEVVMKLMIQDFDLSPTRIKEVVDTLDVELGKLKAQRPDLEWFRERWPRMVWSETFPDFDK